MKKLFFLFLFLTSFATAQENTEIKIIAQKQMETYNAHDIDAYAALFSDDIKVYDFPKKLRYEGKEKLIERYGKFFENTPELYSFIEKRIVSGNTIIDQEKVIYKKGGTPKEFVVMYVVKDQKIAEVYYIKR
ncbi:nuclear transport factor 2 family protein [Kordia sp.]|uniref:nuclear transport factor 2 family protein n=1 Tax=Kordia sp. TaxID=1965332 RepID=UPI0025B8E543|nr:nuclear transport factor 2 family protein [Kordia sp.]MCH2194015.1 nuclear transport factor 2 family protein [Kordia sp.]